MKWNVPKGIKCDFFSYNGQGAKRLQNSLVKPSLGQTLLTQTVATFRKVVVGTLESLRIASLRRGIK